MPSRKTVASDEILQAIAELPEEVRICEVMRYVLENIKAGISCYNENGLEDAVKAFNKALWHIRNIRARKVEYQILMRVQSICYELGRPAHELKHFYR